VILFIGEALMLDRDHPRDRIISGAMRLAASTGWRNLSLGSIAAEAGLNLAELRREFSDKSEILAAFTRAVDDEVLVRVAPSSADVARDRLFDVIITRFEIMQPYRQALRRIRDDLRLHPGQSLRQFCSVSHSQYWMLQAAGVNADGGRGLLRRKGLIALYAAIFPVWLDDDDPGMARTMAALDRRLRRGEAVIHRMDKVCERAEGLLRSLKHVAKPSFRRPESEPDTGPSHAPGFSPDEPPPAPAGGPASAPI
jgi:AcrR family transcriptional regulator